MLTNSLWINNPVRNNEIIIEKVQKILQFRNINKYLDFDFNKIYFSTLLRLESPTYLKPWIVVLPQNTLKNVSNFLMLTLRSEWIVEIKKLERFAFGEKKKFYICMSCLFIPLLFDYIFYFELIDKNLINLSLWWF